MGALTPQFVADLETRMQVLTESEYSRLLGNLYWQQLVKVRTSTGRKDVLTWLQSTARMSDQGKGGNIRFEDMLALKLEIENGFRGTGLKLTKAQLTDTDGGGMDLAAKWSSDVGAQMAYAPQEQMINLLKGGESTADGDGYIGTCYDGLALFSTGHFVNGVDNANGTFSNLYTGTDISTAVSRDVALANLTTVWANIAAIKMPNGVQPRMLRPKFLVTGPKLFPLASQLTSAAFLAQAAASGGGSGDVAPIIRALGYSQPIFAPELAGFESDTTYFVVAEQVTESSAGGLIYVEREPYEINYYTGAGGGTGMDAVLNRANELEWHCRGRNVMAPGHPFLVFKCKA